MHNVSILEKMFFLNAKENPNLFFFFLGPFVCEDVFPQCLRITPIFFFFRTVCAGGSSVCENFGRALLEHEFFSTLEKCIAKYG